MNKYKKSGYKSLINYSMMLILSFNFSPVFATPEQELVASYNELVEAYSKVLETELVCTGKECQKLAMKIMPHLKDKDFEPKFKQFMKDFWVQEEIAKARIHSKGKSLGKFESLGNKIKNSPLFNE